MAGLPSVALPAIALPASPTMALPILPVILVFGVLFVALIIMVFYLVNLYQFGKEGFIFSKARRKGLNVISVVNIGSNEAIFELGTKKKKDDIEYDNKLSGVQIDPSLLHAGAEPTRYSKGLKIYHYAFPDWLPITNKNALAYKAIREWKDGRKEYDFLTLLEFTTLISTPKNHLKHDIGNYIQKKTPVYRYEENGNLYEKELDHEEIGALIDAAKEEISKLPIANGFFAYSLAFENIPMAYSAQDLEQLKILIRKQVEAEWLAKINIMLYAIAALVIMVGGGVTVFIVSKAAGG